MGKGYTIYTFYTGMEFEGSSVFATLAEAVASAKDLLDYNEDLEEIEIEKVQTPAIRSHARSLR